MRSLVTVLRKLLGSRMGSRVTQMLCFLSHALSLELPLHLEGNLLECLQSQHDSFLRA